MILSATYRGEEIEVEFRARGVKVDYGVPRSPIETEVVDIEIDTLTILGIEVSPKDLPSALVAHIHGLADDLEFRE